MNTANENVKKWAEKLDGREYGSELTDIEKKELKALGLVVVFGASDDLCEFRGAIDDEVGCFDGEWIFGIYLDENHIGIFHDDTETKDCEIDVFQIIPETLGEYTGLTDKNGKRIFEGDIIIFSKKRNLPNYSPQPELIKWHKGDCAFQRFPYGSSLTTSGAGRLLQPDMMPECEVIGNIHDNHELLEGF